MVKKWLKSLRKYWKMRMIAAVSGLTLSVSLIPIAAEAPEDVAACVALIALLAFVFFTIAVLLLYARFR